METESSETLHCLEMNTGKNLTGILQLSDGSIRAHIYSYDERFNIHAEGPIFLLTEKNAVVSLYWNITTSSGSSSRLIQPARTTYSQDIISSIAVIGHDQWTDADKVKRVIFAVEHVDQLLAHNAKMTELGRVRHPDESHFTIYKDFAKGVTLKAYYSATYGMEFDAPTKVWPTFEIEFDNAPTLYEYIGYVDCYVQFLSFCLGVRLRPSAIRISRQSHDEMIAAVETHSYPADHEVHYIWPDTKIESRDLWVGGSPLRAWDDNELNAFRKCLVTWVNRYPVWRNPSILMMTSMKLRGEISAERLINACRWFEEIPLANSQSAISDEHIESIASAAAEAAEQLGYREARPSLYESAARFQEDSLFADHNAMMKELLYKIIYSKTLDWEYESEYRLAIPLGHGEKDWNALAYHPNEIAELYLGAKMSTESKAEIVGLAQAVNPHIKIFEMFYDANGKLSAWPR